MTTEPSDTFKPLLELELHLADGSTRKFFQDDATAAHQILEQIGNGRVFQQPNLILNGRDTVFTCPGAALNRIDFNMDPLPDDLHHLLQTNGFEMWEISQEEWRERYRPEADHTTQRTAIHEGDRIVAFNEVRLWDGQRFFLESPLSARSETEQRHLLHHIFSTPGLVCHRRGGGLSIWNVSRILSCTFYPGPPHVPSTAWKVESWPDSTPEPASTGPQPTAQRLLSPAT